jgi:hypothetical protein
VSDNGLDIFRYTPPYGPEDMQREIDILRVALAKSNAERDEARRECRLLLLGQDVLRGVRDLPTPPDDLVTIVPVPRKEDGK